MRLIALALLGLSTLTVLAQQADAPDAKDLAALKGQWVITKFEVDDQDQQFLVNFKVEVAGSSFFLKPPTGDKVELTMKLDPSTTPKCVDLTIVKDKQLFEGIYTMEEGGVWKLCVAAPNRAIKARPIEFSSKDNFIMLTLKRSEP